ncbi:MAG TPA: hypothetical protein VJK04_04390 [Candidatus Paceibacterota bacterium]
MDEQTGLFLIGYMGLLLPAGIGFFWMESWLYSKKKVTRHWLYATTLLVPMVSMVLFFRGGSSRGTFFAVLLPPLACAVGAALGGIFGQFFHENHQQKDKIE